MLTPKTINKIRAQTLRYWQRELRKPEIVNLARGKEIGHKLADLVDEKTTALLTCEHLVAHEHSRKGNVRVRGMGDLWLQENGIYHAVNVKTGVAGAETMPNLVSLKKILTAVMARQIDSYCLLIVKVSIDDKKGVITPSVYFFDMLEWLDYVTFDAGPGQMMLQASKFYAEYESASPARASIKQKLEKLMALYEDGHRRLMENRRRTLNEFRQKFKSFMAEDESFVTTEAQQALNLR